MASFGKDVEGFSASRSVHIIGTETVENYTVNILEVDSHMGLFAKLYEGSLCAS